MRLPITKQFKYLGSVLSNDALVNEDIKARISKASSAYGRLQERVWKPHGIRLNTKIKVYKATVLTTLLYGAETWTCYRRHVKMLDTFHMRHLRYLMGIKWQDKETNNEVMRRAQMDGIEAMLMRAQLRWVGHVQRMSDNRIPKQIFYSELTAGSRNRGGQRKRYKDTLKQNLKLAGIDTETWHELAENRPAWRRAVKKGIQLFEVDRVKTREDKRQKRKAKEALNVNVQPNPSAVFVCQTCGRAC